MNLHRVREEMRAGRSIFDLPLRVTFYARVSTDRDEQLNSLENQVQYYTELIKSSPCWIYTEGYVDEGISGTSTKRRDSFNRMIEDAKAGLFDFIITKEISRFSRSTLDSILYTQMLLDCDVGVLFQNDNINTLDSDSEFRLVVMAGVAQDEVRKLSERLKFGFRQAIRNGRVLGNDSLWGYDKRDCALTVNEPEAQIVRRIFELYANSGLGIRRISQTLLNEGFTGRSGAAFNTLTIRHILCNPKYKGWYCGNKTKNLDYKSKRKVCLDESEWLCYPDPSIPAIVSEELWDRANALYKLRSTQASAHRAGADYHSRYPYSGKIICQKHGSRFYRQLLKSAKGEKEVWQCSVYRSHGRAACSAPQIFTGELDSLMACILSALIPNRDILSDAVCGLLASAPDGDERQMLRHFETELAAVRAKKERLLDRSIEGALSTEEFKKRNGSLSAQAAALEGRLKSIQAAAGQDTGDPSSSRLRGALFDELDFENGISSAVAAAVLDHLVVREESTKETLYLDLYPKLGPPVRAVVDRGKNSFCFTPFS